MHRRRWQIVTSALISLIILVLAFVNRQWLLEAFGLVREANLRYLVIALGMILLSYLISSQVFQVVLRSLGYRLGVVRLWATALVAIVISQSVPAGGVGSYAFLVSMFTRHKVPSGQSTLVASLETLSYASAMLLIFTFSLLYLMVHRLGGTFGGAQLVEPLVAGGIALLVIGGAVFVLTRNEAVLTRWLLAVQNMLAWLLRRNWDETWVRRIVADLAQGRALLASRPYAVVTLVLIQVAALSGHSLALLIVLLSLGVHTTLGVVLTAFGIALITSTFNVLPGGGGTVEAALIAVLSLLGVGAAAIPAAIIFRLMNYWLLMPVAVGCYHWLMNGKRTAGEATAS